MRPAPNLTHDSSRSKKLDFKIRPEADLQFMKSFLLVVLYVLIAPRPHHT